MATNRKNQSTAIRFGSAVKAVLLCSIIGGSAVGYVWQKNQIQALGQQIKQCETKLESLRRQNKVQTQILANLRSPAYLDRRVKELNLGLIKPQPEQIWWLVEQPSVPPSFDGGPKLAGQ